MSRVREALSSDLGERYPRLATAAWAVAGLLGACVVLLTVASAVGFLLGGLGSAGEPPSVDFKDDPATVIADASDRLEYSDYVVEEWIRRSDRRDGSVGGGMFSRFYVERSRGQVRGHLPLGSPYSTSGFIGDRPVDAVFVTEGAAWAKPRDAPYWQRSGQAANVTREALSPLQVSEANISAESVTVVADNESVWVAELPADAARGIDGGATVRYVVAKDPEPHLQSVRIHRQGLTQDRKRVIRVLDYGEATAPRPEGVPWTTVGEVSGRIARGLDRLA